MKLALAIVLLLLGPHAYAAPIGLGCDDAALQAAQRYSVPPQIMLAMARVESGRGDSGVLTPWPWTINNAGTPAWFATREDALHHTNGLIDAGQSNIDIGCFQLNLYWHGKNFSSLEDMFEPMRNADYAARFLVEKYQLKGNWVDAVAAYHSERIEHASDYIEKVESVLLDLNEAPPTNRQPESRRNMAPRASEFPLLHPGASGALASLVPLRETAQPLFAVSN